ncbi:chitin binding peritrophin-A domain-containing protein [Nocardia sp. XZ_19_369]|uniref:chitin binding peritrophin-A domain-containing protein n=1 Tax=Nocardia sp. XZ_19_369 TaxID=2769487 RepID=UPI0018901F28|nr:chitin binding peritrophin-A domain-containing protein [Nocardia sp. XZ_19_369]
MKSNSLACRTGVLAAGTVLAVLPPLGVAAMTLGTMTAVDMPEGTGRDIAARQYAVVPIEARSDFCDGKSAGHYVDPADRAVFYRCVSSRTQPMATYQFRCAEDGWYDERRLVCVGRTPR